MNCISEIEDKYQFVLVRSPYELMQFPVVREIFPNLIRFKTEGYRKEYGQSVLPFDTSDFIASHLLLCEKNSSGILNPVLGFKSVTLQKCDEHQINFPILHFFNELGPQNPYETTLKQIIMDYRNKKLAHKIAYNGSFTISSQLRENKELMKHLWDLSFSLLANYYIDYSIDHVLAVCATKFKINEKKEKNGWNYIKGDSGILRPYVCKTFFDATAVPMEITEVKEKGLESSMKFKTMWKNRLTLDLEHLTDEKAAA